MNDLDAILANLKRGNIGKAHDLLAELAATPAARVVKGCVRDGRQSLTVKIVAANERMAAQRVALGKVTEELVSVQARLENLESGQTLPGWMKLN